ITPALKNLYRDVVWALDFNDGSQRVPLYLCLLLEFQSSPEPIMPLRMLNYAASFYQDLIETKKLRLSVDKLPPALPIVLYSGESPWNAATRMQDVIAPVAKVLRAFQPQLAYFLLDEHRVTQEALEHAPELLANTLLLNHVEDAEAFSALWQVLQRKVKSHPDFELLDRTIARWFAYSLHLKGTKIKLEDTTTIDEVNAMWTFESEIERISQERAQIAAKAAEKQALSSAQQALLSAQRKHEQQLEQNARASAKRLAQRGMSYAEIAEVLSIAAEKVAEYVDE